MVRLVAILVLMTGLVACQDPVRKAELDGYECAYGKMYSIGHTTFSCRQDCNKLYEPAEKQACFKGVHDGEADKKGERR